MIASKTKAHLNFRGDLTKEIIQKGYDVSVVVPHDLYKKELEKLGVKVIVMPYNKNSISVFSNMSTLKKLKKIMQEEKPDKVFAYTKKDVVRLDGSLTTLMQDLNDDRFFRCSKSMIINIEKVDRLKSLSSNRIDATMESGEHILISRTYASEFRRTLRR